MTYKQAIQKLRIERIGMFPFVALGKLFGKIFRLGTQHRLFLFFPSADIGGAPQVNIDITLCLKDAKPIIIFSKKPLNNQFKPFFDIEGVRIIDLHRYIDHKLFHFVNFFFRGVLASWINGSKNPVVFGGESLFFYKVIPHIRKDIPCIELCHLGTWMPYTIGFIDRIDKRVFSTLKLKQDVVRQYDENHIAKELYNRLYFVDNATEIPGFVEVNNPKTEVIFIGRGSPQKRVHLIAAIAKKMQEANDPVHFSFVGDVDRVINPEDYPYCTFYGNVNDPARMKKIYQDSDVLILTSAFEGLPMVVMTMMAYGKTVLSTAVNGIPDYIHHMENGLLITSPDEEEIITEGVLLLRYFHQHPELKTKFSERNRTLSQEKFSMNAFCKSYRELLLGEKKG
ncbi:MAG TPA: glycosyltransferase family 4 protein [Puia sp.]|nr:glycosyltransferase family 4 protein [Puia sp.]